ncbi:MAG: outer membrane lipoprotein-sorting protein [Bacteroidetes bacterium]|nr:outer membrane lipoprotein-sorting protein [Bacteroidota bacterium]MBT5531307.1 outer membrane lipoprotein-sorting protein [Cytophagia bacterium]MBT3423558.1 outer membrane lipoprotein-sorting protein [Bacteroidota bacterium]MBT3802477.1 outer membrane lipoprotein-sorting protein [Bacteroidota bacterium]MBT3933479.1 outer membrane lipoprotein-sorting protein [Bacteroidota bacterium]
MKKIAFTLIICTIALSGAIAQTALEIIEKADAKHRGISSYGEMSMTIVRKNWTRTVEMKSWTKGSDQAMIYITSPVKEKGQVFLKRGKEMWNWMPSIDRMIKIPPSMMMQGWMGSDFTNDDLVEQSSSVKDYKHTLLGKSKVREVLCYKIELIPKEDAPVVWGKIIMWITVDGFDTWAAEYYDEDNELVNVEKAYDIKTMGDRTIPTRIEIIPVGKKGEKTILQIIDMKFNEKLEDDFFSQQNMKRIR